MDGWQTKVLEKLPLAEAVLQAWCYLTDEEFLAGVFERYRGRCYAGTLCFDSLVRLTGDALMEHAGSGNRAFRQADRRGELEVTAEACYGKLRRISQSLSHGFLAEGSQRLRAALAKTTSPVPRSLRNSRSWGSTARRSSVRPNACWQPENFRGACWAARPWWHSVCRPAWSWPCRRTWTAKPTIPRWCRSCWRKCARSCRTRGGTYWIDNFAI